jgi:hypothetical protein
MISDQIPGVPQKIQHPGNLGSQKKEPKLLRGVSKELTNG